MRSLERHAKLLILLVLPLIAPRFTPAQQPSTPAVPPPLPAVIQVQAMAAAAPPASDVEPPPQLNCPGRFPSDLTVLNCRYTQGQRLEQFLTTGVTDEAVLLSIAGSLFTQSIHSPGEWPRTFQYYGYRVGSSYTGSLGRATGEYIVGSILRDDPRHVKCSDDPKHFRFQHGSTDTSICTKGQRFAHFLIDSVTVRRSVDGFMVGTDPRQLSSTDQRRYNITYRRLPAFDRLFGLYAGAYAQYPWEPRSANTFGAVSQRAGLSFASTLLGSFFTEYGTSIFGIHKKKTK